jgi:hypothetical protein
LNHEDTKVTKMGTADPLRDLCVFVVKFVRADRAIADLGFPQQMQPEQVQRLLGGSGSQDLWMSRIGTLENYRSHNSRTWIGDDTVVASRRPLLCQFRKPTNGQTVVRAKSLSHLGSRLGDHHVFVWHRVINAPKLS